MIAENNARQTLGDTYDEYLKYGTPGEREAAQIGFTEGYAQGVLRGAVLGGALKDFIPAATNLPASEATADETEPQYYSSNDIGYALGTNGQRVLRVLAAEGVLLKYEGDDAIHYRPAEEYFSKGWFIRIERFSVSENCPYFQTAVTKIGRQPVLDLLRAALPKYPLKSQQK